MQFVPQFPCVLQRIVLEVEVKLESRNMPDKIYFYKSVNLIV